MNLIQYQKLQICLSRHHPHYTCENLVTAQVSTFCHERDPCLSSQSQQPCKCKVAPQFACLDGRCSYMIAAQYAASSQHDQHLHDLPKSHVIICRILQLLSWFASFGSSRVRGSSSYLGYEVKEDMAGGVVGRQWLPNLFLPCVSGHIQESSAQPGGSTHVCECSISNTLTKKCGLKDFRMRKSPNLGHEVQEVHAACGIDVAGSLFPVCHCAISCLARYTSALDSQEAARRSVRAKEVLLDMCSTRTSPQAVAKLSSSSPTRSMTTCSKSRALLLGCMHQAVMSVHQDP